MIYCTVICCWINCSNCYTFRIKINSLHLVILISHALVDVGQFFLESCSTGFYDNSDLFQWVLPDLSFSKLVNEGNMLLECCSTGSYDESVMFQWVLQYFTSAKLVDVGSLLLESCWLGVTIKVCCCSGCYNILHLLLNWWMWTVLLESCLSGCYDKSVLFQWVLKYFTSAKLVNVGNLLF